MRVSGWLYLLEQTGCCLALLYAAGCAAGLRQRPGWRLMVTACLCGIGCLCAAWTAVDWLRPVLLAPMLVLAPMAAYPGVPTRMKRLMAVQGGVMGLALTGGLRLMGGLPGLLSLIPLCWLMPLLPRLFGSRTAAPCTGVAFRLHEVTVTLNALVDSGNLLRDPVSGLPVIVCARRALRRMPLDGRSKDASGRRCISVRTAGGTAIMVLVRPDAVRVRLPDGWHEVRAMIGLMPEGYDGCEALVPSCLTKGSG